MSHGFTAQQFLIEYNIREGRLKKKLLQSRLILSRMKIETAAIPEDYNNQSVDEFQTPDE